MSGLTRYGADLSSLVEAQAPIYSLDDRGRASVQYFYHCLASAALGLIPAYNSAAPTPYATLKRREVSMQLTAPQTMLMTVTYREPGGSTPPAVGDVTRESSASMTEVPIEQVDGITDAQILAAKNNGIHTVLRFTVSYSNTEMVSSLTWSQSNIISGIGQRSAPTGMTSPATDTWLKVGRTMREGDVASITDTWAYDERKWQNVEANGGGWPPPTP
jgi:hypothetical protein